MHSCDVLCVAWSADSELLVSGDAQGTIKVWQVSTGKCVRRFKSAHEKGVTSVSFSSDLSNVLSSSHDGTVRLHGLRSGKTLKFFRGHTSFVHAAAWGPRCLVSCSTDGTVRVWDKKTEQSRALVLANNVMGLEQGAGGSPAAIVGMVLARDNEPAVLVCNRTNVLFRLHLLSGQGNSGIRRR